MVYTEAEFAEQIIMDLITRGYSSNDLLEQFRQEVSQKAGVMLWE